MSTPLLSLIALLIAIVLSITTQINVGLLALAFAWLIGVYGAHLAPEVVISGFPASLFLTLAGVTLLFALAEANGTLHALATRLVRRTSGNRRLLPLVFFVVAFALSSAGPGAISTVALLAPLAMALGRQAGFSPFLIALMVANGANAGNLSPVSAVGVIANTKMAEAGLVGHEGRVWLWNMVTHLVVAAIAYAVLARRPRREATPPDPREAAEDPQLTGRMYLTMALLAAWVVGVIAFKLHIGLAAFAAASLLIVLRVSDERSALRLIPLGVILMVCGVTVLIALLERTGGMDLFTSLLARLASPASLNGMIAFITGLISTYSSTSGVVLPAFLPTAGDLVVKVGGGDPLAVALSINLGASLVDVSPLSTLGALCVAAVSDHSESRRLFRRLMVWGVSMAIVGALFAQLFAGVVARA
ncbi:MAG: SLC13 family permease [Gemmatimonadaceae bacterium]